jgi:hypothetical protein
VLRLLLLLGVRRRRPALLCDGVRRDADAWWPLGVGGSVLALLVGIANQVVVLMEVLLLRRVLYRLWLVDTSAPA